MRPVWTGSTSYGLINIPEKFSIEKYKDTYTAKLLKRIKEKSKGKVVHKQSDDLMDMLKAGLAGK